LQFFPIPVHNAVNYRGVTANGQGRPGRKFFERVYLNIYKASC
jgi:hypothetical protein